MVRQLNCALLSSGRHGRRVGYRMQAHRPGDARHQQGDGDELEHARRLGAPGKAVEHGRYRLEQDQLTGQGDGQAPAGDIPQVVADHGRAQRQHAVIEPEQQPVARRCGRLRAAGVRPEHRQRADRQRDQAAGQAIQRGPLAAAELRIALEVARVVQRIPGPAGQRPGRAGQAKHGGRQGRPACLGMAEGVDIDAGDRNPDYEQRQHQAFERHRALVAPAQQGHRDRDQADDERSRRHAGQLHAEGQQHVIHEVAAQGLAQQRGMVARTQETQQAAQARQHQAEGNRAIGEVAPHRQLDRRKAGQQFRHEEHHAPQGARQHAAQHSSQHNRILRPAAAPACAPRKHDCARGGVQLLEWDAPLGKGLACKADAGMTLAKNDGATKTK